jgi:hypothetical protein
VKFTDIKKLRAEYGQKVFDLLDESFAELYGTVPLTQKQKDYYIGKYLPFANPSFIEMVATEAGELVGFIIALPSLSRAFQKARGRLFPFGLFYIMRALRKFDTIDFMLAGIRKEFRGKGADLLMTLDIFRTGIAKGVRFGESNPELETNSRIQNEWKIISSRQHKRRRIYRKSIE